MPPKKAEVKSMHSNLFTSSPSVQSSRILYSPSPFARSSLLHLQEVGSLSAIRPHTSKREKLQSYLCFMVEDGEGELVYEGKKYDLKSGDVVFIDCRKAYSHSTDRKLWSLRWCHFYGTAMYSVFEKYKERGGKPAFHAEKPQAFADLLSELYTLSASADYIRDMRINEKLSLESVANHFFINKHYLARLFKEQYGVTLVTYLQQVRITHAKRMLRFTDKSIEETGLECGIGDLNYFSRVFKKLEGVSPSEFRRVW